MLFESVEMKTNHDAPTRMTTMATTDAKTAVGARLMPSGLFTGCIVLMLRTRASFLQPILKGIQVYHNLFRPHEGLDGQTPARRAGIQIEGENPWLTVIQNASHGPRVDNAQNPRDGPPT